MLYNYSRYVAHITVKMGKIVFKRMGIVEYGKRNLERTWRSTKSYVKNNPGEARSSAFGLGLGTTAGYMVGGSVGIVGFFGGIGVPIVMITACRWDSSLAIAWVWPWMQKARTNYSEVKVSDLLC